jgi:hypothetical protein
MQRTLSLSSRSGSSTHHAMSFDDVSNINGHDDMQNDFYQLKNSRALVILQGRLKVICQIYYPYSSLIFDNNVLAQARQKRLQLAEQVKKVNLQVRRRSCRISLTLLAV